MKDLQSLFNRYAEVKITIPDTLFEVEPEWEMLRKARCPVCGNKLIFLKNKSGAICRGKRHGDKRSFFVTSQKLAKLGLRK